MLIEVDEYKKMIPNYDPEQSELFHRESAHLADIDFIKQLKSQKYSEVIFMAGGAASGKTEFSTSFLINDEQLIYDGTLKNFDGFKIKLGHIKKYAKNKPKTKVILIIPDDWKQSFEIFLSRERKMEVVTFFDTHIRSKIAVARVLLETEINVEIYLSSLIPGTQKLSFKNLEVDRDNRNVIINKLIAEAKILDIIAKDQGFEIQVNYDIV